MLLKSSLRFLIKRFGIFAINDMLGEIFDNEFDKTQDMLYDDLSESYDRINLRLKHSDKKGA
jgi:hypothetical protein